MAIGDTVSTHVFSIELGHFQVETVQDVGDLAFGQEVVEIKRVTSAGELVIRKQPGGRRPGEVTITRGLDKSPAFTDWIKTTRTNADADSARQNLAIVVMDAQKNPVRRINLLNAWASNWSGPSLQAGGSNPVQERVMPAFEDLTVE
ncbi:phage tail protein [Streptomyces roseoverticillatus]|uniref:Phage tail protein n=1 Tax=Streptomyces roseoverticillatus TaxID=66429 RepID=A0ABV3IXW7_9ACTN